MINFTKLLNTNEQLKKLYGSAHSEESKRWLELANYGKNVYFKTEKSFTELVALMLQIKKLDEKEKSHRGLRYSEHFHNFFSLLSDSSKEYEIFRRSFAGMELRSIQ